jgi:signal peptidase I
MVRRCVILLAVWCAVGLGFLASTDVRASLWASAVITTTPDTWVAQLLPTGSMAPALTEDDWLIFQRLPFGQVRPGDIISFRCPLDGEPVTHRVATRMSDGRLLTRGDANPGTDPWIVGPEHYRGMLIAVYSDR